MVTQISIVLFKIIGDHKRKNGNMNMDVVSIQQELGTKVLIGKVKSGGLYKKLTCPAGLTDLEWKKYHTIYYFDDIPT